MCPKCGCGYDGGRCTVSWIIKILVVIGGINWGLVGLGMLMSGGDMSKLNVVHMLLGSWPMVEAIVYLLVGVAAIMKLFHCKCKKCMGACTCNAGGMGDGMNKGM